MEDISRERLHEILLIEIANPTALTAEIMAANGFTPFMPAPDFIIWTNDHDVTLIQEDEVYAGDSPFLFQFGEEEIEKFEIKYEHQLKMIIDDYESRLIKEVGQLNLF